MFNTVVSIIAQWTEDHCFLLRSTLEFVIVAIIPPLNYGPRPVAHRRPAPVSLPAAPLPSARRPRAASGPQLRLCAAAVHCPPDHCPPPRSGRLLSLIESAKKAARPRHRQRTGVPITHRGPAPRCRRLTARYRRGDGHRAPQDARGRVEARRPRHRGVFSNPGGAPLVTQRRVAVPTAARRHKMPAACRKSGPVAARYRVAAVQQHCWPPDLTLSLAAQVVAARSRVADVQQRC